MSVLLRRFLVVGSVLGAAVLSVSPSQAASLGFYSVDRDTDELVSIDASTGAVNVIGSLGVDVNDIDLTLLDGTLYGVSTRFPQQTALLQIDTTTGMSTFLGNLLRGGNPIRHAEGLTSKDGKLFAGFSTSPRGNPSSYLGELQLDGTIVNDRNLGFNIDQDGLGASPSGVLFSSDGVPGINTTFLRTIEPTQTIGSYRHDVVAFNDLDFFGDDLFGISTQHGLLHKIDSSNGTLIDTVTLNRDGTYLGLATIPDDTTSTPEPSTLLGLGTLALAGGVLLRRRRKG